MALLSALHDEDADENADAAADEDGADDDGDALRMAESGFGH